MTARVIDGAAIAAGLRAKGAAAAQRLARGHGLVPGRAVVLTGHNPASAVYVRNKAAQTEAAGMRSFIHRLPATASAADLLDRVAMLNADAAVHGILVQLPLPPQIDPRGRRGAVLLCAAVGRPEMVRGDWIKPDATVIDVGINRVAAESGKHRLVGDVAYGGAVARSEEQ